MLRVRAVQWEALSRASEERFIRRLCRHLIDWFSDLRGTPPAALRPFVRAGLVDARGHGFTTERDASRFIAIQRAIGADFASRYPWAVRILADRRGLSPAYKIRYLMEHARAVDPDTVP